MQAVVGGQAVDAHVVDITVRTGIAVDQAIGRIGEIHRAIGAEHAVVGRVQALAHVVVDQHGLLFGGQVDAEDGTAARAGDDQPATPQDQAVGTRLADRWVPSHAAHVITGRREPDRAALFG